MGKNLDKPRWQACNVMNLDPTGPGLWEVTVSGGRYACAAGSPLQGAAAVNPKVVGKDWNEMVKPRLNIAWLPPDQVFVRVVQLPQAESLQETLSMLEFQLEKLSPLPAAQIVWTFEVVPSRGMLETQTVVLVVVARHAVEELLGKLEVHGYLADRIEFPFLDQLLAVEVNKDCAILFPITTQEGSRFVWVAWWIGGVLQSLGQIHIPPSGDAGEIVQGQLGQMVWAGEAEGWLNAPLRHYLVADEGSASEWLNTLEGRMDPPAELIPAASASSLALLSAKRAIQAAPRPGLLPPDFTARYRQRFVDKLWMQGLFGVLACYLFVILIYFAIVSVKQFQRDNLYEQEIVQGNAYTNTIKLRDQVRVLQDQINLQFLALNCYLAIATNLPEDLTLESMNFDRGAKVILHGKGGAEAGNKVYDFVSNLKAARDNDRSLFSTIEGPALNLKSGPTPEISWNLTANIRRPDSQ